MNLATARFRQAIINSIRSFFTDRGYLETDVPVLSPEFIPEEHIQLFETEFSSPFIHGTKLFLLPSPEYWMKQLLAKGYGNIFTIAKAFRNSETIGAIHNPEFSLLEWYTIDADYIDSLVLTEQLFQYLNIILPPCLAPPFRRMTMHEAWYETLGIDLDTISEYGTLAENCLRYDISVAKNDSWEDLFFKLFISRIEPELPQDKPLALLDYPAQLPCTAKKRGNVFERWELYIKGVEICNCYSENENTSDFSQFLNNEKNKIVTRQAVGAEYALKKLAGFPRCSGNALGIDRLIMLLAGKTTLQGVNFFPFSDILP